MLKIDALIDLFFTDSAFPIEWLKLLTAAINILKHGKAATRPELKAMSDAGKTCGVELVSIVMNFAFEEKVAPIRAENKAAFIEQMDRYSDNALAAGCKQGIVTTGQAVEGRNYQEQRKALIEALASAGELVAKKVLN